MKKKNQTERVVESRAPLIRKSAFIYFDQWKFLFPSATLHKLQVHLTVITESSKWKLCFDFCTYLYYCSHFCGKYSTGDEMGPEFFSRVHVVQQVHPMSREQGSMATRHLVPHLLGAGGGGGRVLTERNKKPIWLLINSLMINVSLF